MTISLHLSCISIFVIVFLNLHRGIWSAPAVLTSTLMLTLTGFTVWDSMAEGASLQRGVMIKSGFLLLLMLFGLAPLLKTLTLDITLDSIWALTLGAFSVNAIFHDYSSANYTRIIFPGSISTNAATFSSVLLASRLNSTLQVATLLSFATIWFALLPIFQRHLRVN